MKTIIKIIPWLLWLVLGQSLAQQGEDDADVPKADAALEQQVQEIKYVTDKLRLSLYREANDRSGTLKLLVSGDELKILERSGPYAKVIIDDGTVGWVKNGFLVSEPTASFQLIEERKKNEILANQIEKYSDTRKLIDDYENTISMMGKDNEALTSEHQQLVSKFEALSVEHEDMQQEVAAMRAQTLSPEQIIGLLKQFWYIIVVAVLLLLLIGFQIGRYLIEAQVRKRFQGVKVW